MDDPDLALKLIEQVKNYECLYNPNDAYFNDYKHKNCIWKIIAHELNITDRMAQRKWKRIKDNHKAQILRRLENTKCRRRSLWSRLNMYAEELKFLEIHFTYKSRKDPTKCITYAELLKERSAEDTILNETCTKTTTATLEEEHLLEDEWENLESSCTNKDIPTANTSDIEFVNIDNSLNVNSAIRAILKKQKVIDFENIEAADPLVIKANVNNNNSCSKDNDKEYLIESDEDEGSVVHKVNGDHNLNKIQAREDLEFKTNANKNNNCPEINDEEDVAIDLESDEDDDTIYNDHSKKNNFQARATKKNEIYLLNRNLINQVRKYECLYNPAVPGYDSIDYRRHVFEGIGKKIGISGEIVKAKWYKIKLCYKRYKQKLLQQKGFVKPYQFSKYLKFLDEYICESNFINSPTKNEIN